MGYKRTPKLYQLTFEDHPGLEVTMRALDIDGFTKLARLAGGLKNVDLRRAEGPELNAALAAMDEMFARFAKALREWNLEDDDGPVPATAEGVRGQDLDFILEILTGWMDAIASVDTPLNGSSPSTPPSALGLSGQMAPLSPSLVS